MSDRVPAGTLPTYVDGQVLYGRNLNTIIAVLSAAANANKSQSDKTLLADSSLVFHSITAANSYSSANTVPNGTRCVIVNGGDNEDIISFYTYNYVAGAWEYEDIATLERLYELITTAETFDLKYLVLDTQYNVGTLEDGMIYYDKDQQALTYVHVFDNGAVQSVNIGQEEFIIAKNANGTLVDGNVVYMSGVQGNHLLCYPASANSAYPEKSILLGVLTAPASENDFIPVTMRGKVHGVDFTLIMETGTNFNDFVFGAKMYLSATEPGKYTLVEPEYPDSSVWVATVIDFNVNNYRQGIMYVNPIHIAGVGIGTNIIYSNTEPAAGMSRTGDYLFLIQEEE